MVFVVFGTCHDTGRFSKDRFEFGRFGHLEGLFALEAQNGYPGLGPLPCGTHIL